MNGSLRGHLARGQYIARFARLVDHPVRFAAAEMRGAPPVGRYRPRSSSRDVLVRHRTGDLYILEEIFGRKIYELPASVRDQLSSPDVTVRVLDLGGHVGMFAAWCAGRFARAEFLVFEPDPHNAGLLREVTSMPGFGHPCDIVGACAGAQVRNARLAGGRFSTSHLLTPGEEDDGHTIDVPVVDVVPLLAGFDLVKIDIEGAEWEILSDSRFADAGPRALALEYHPHPSLTAPARDSAVELLGDAGYAIESVQHVPEHGVGMLWAWR